jgi:transcriptional regulator with XRE-family HTH domain
MAKIVTGAELCDELRISPSTLARYRESGSIPYLLLPSASGGQGNSRRFRYDLDAVLEALEPEDEDEDEDLESSGDDEDEDLDSSGDDEDEDDLDSDSSQDLDEDDSDGEDLDEDDD